MVGIYNKNRKSTKRYAKKTSDINVFKGDDCYKIIDWGKEMKKSCLLLMTCIMIITSSVAAHVPYFEHCDFSEEHPFVIRKNPDQSKAVYAWLKFDEQRSCTDIDVYSLSVPPTIYVRMYVELIIPVVDDFYEEFVPWFALVGPGLPPPNQTLPFELPDGCGVIVVENVEPGTERETFYEPFGGKSYYIGPTLEETLYQTGEKYYVYVWDPYQLGGDYVLVIGKKEIFGPFDILRALFYTPLIRRGLELHI